MTKGTKWISTRDRLPEKGTLVSVKIANGSCSCSGYTVKNCYYEEKFYNAIQHRVRYWGPPLDNY